MKRPSINLVSCVRYLTYFRKPTHKAERIVQVFASHYKTRLCSIDILLLIFDNNFYEKLARGSYGIAAALSSQIKAVTCNILQ